MLEIRREFQSDESHLELNRSVYSKLLYDTDYRDSLEETVERWWWLSILMVSLYMWLYTGSLFLSLITSSAIGIATFSAPLTMLIYSGINRDMYYRDISLPII